MSKSDETLSTGRRGLLKDLLGLSAAVSLLPLASPAQAGIGDQPPRRPGLEGRRYGMLVDLRECIGCQACTVSCSVEYLPPIGQFRTTVLQYAVTESPDAPSALINPPRLCHHGDERRCVPVCRVQASFQGTDGIVLV